MQTKDILDDLNLLIADIETYKLTNETVATKFEFTRTLGQLKAARASFVRICAIEAERSVA